MSSEEQPPPDDHEALDAVFDLLSHRFRRILLSELRGHDGPQALADLTKAVTVQQQDTSIDEVPDEELDRIHTMLYHIHIPKLEDAGAAAFDEEQKTVTLTARGKSLESLVDRVIERSAPPPTED